MENDTAEKTVKNDYHFADYKAKMYYQANKGKIQKSFRQCYKNSSEDKNIKNRNYANYRNRNMSVADRERRKENVKHYHYKRKNIVEFV